jgi:hypothetical protein
VPDDVEITIGIAGAFNRNDQPGSLRLICEEKREYEAEEENSCGH